jgi:two-component sensor histidine kinase
MASGCPGNLLRLVKSDSFMNNGILINGAALALSFFITILLFWLGLMVLLAGDRRSPGTWFTAVGLLLGALFFTSHTAILGSGLSTTSLGMDLWWWVSWTPAVIAPLAWYTALLWYAGYRFRPGHRHHAGFITTALLALCLPLLLVFANPLPSYQYVAGRTLVLTPHLGGVPLLILAYVFYSLLCYLLPIDLLRHPPDRGPLETHTRRRARPYLMSASIAMLLAGGVLAWTALWAIKSQPLPSLADPQVELTLLRFDLAVEALVAAAVVLLGRTIVGFEVFTGHPLPRNRFFSQWRGTLFLAGGFGVIAAGALVIELRPIYTLLLATALMVLFYALYSWRSFAEREAFMDRLRPFLASQNLYGQITGPQPQPQEGVYPLFETLCGQVLEIRSALLLPVGTLANGAGPPLDYPRGSWASISVNSLVLERFTPQRRCLPIRDACLPDGPLHSFEWAVGLWSSRGLDGVLLLGEKANKNPYSDEEIEIAQTAGERMLDVLAGGELARMTIDLLRQRLAQSRVLEGQGRRVLHDEILPQLHAAMLYLHAAPETDRAIELLSASHRRISDLMRDLPLATPVMLAQKGLVAALRQVVENEFARSFKSVDWQIQEEAVRRSSDLPIFVNEVLYFAARELIRNAADHALGGEDYSGVCLTIRFEGEGCLHLVVEDSGKGFFPLLEPSEQPKGSGLRIHSAMLAAVGGRLEVGNRTEGGTRAVISLEAKYL